MTNVFSILAFMLLLNEGSVEKNRSNSIVKKWIVEKSSSLNIQGETNVNSFRCEIKEYLNTDTLFYNNDVANKLSFTNSILRIDIRRFDCHNKFITSDFRSALKADENSALTITFLSLDQFPKLCNNQSVKGLVEIKLAHISKRIEIGFFVKTLAADRFLLTGTHDFTFSDFELKAPRKLSGLIRTKDKIKVNFQLCFKAV